MNFPLPLHAVYILTTRSENVCKYVEIKDEYASIYIRMRRVTRTLAKPLSGECHKPPTAFDTIQKWVHVSNLTL